MATTQGNMHMLNCDYFLFKSIQYNHKVVKLGRPLLFSFFFLSAEPFKDWHQHEFDMLSGMFLEDCSTFPWTQLFLLPVSYCVLLCFQLCGKGIRYKGEEFKKVNNKKKH